MGLSSSKSVTGKLDKSPEFISACETVYSQSLTLSQQSFPGIPRYQIALASDRLYQTLSDSNIPLINKWATSPPSLSQIDKSLQRVVTDDDVGDAVVKIRDVKFKEFAVDLYSDAIVSNARKDVLLKLHVGVDGIIGIGHSFCYVRSSARFVSPSHFSLPFSWFPWHHHQIRIDLILIKVL